MVVQSDPTVFYCGRGHLPGTQGQGTGGTEPTLNPIVYVPKPKEPDPPFIPPIPPQQPSLKCVIVSVGENAPPPPPGFTYKNGFYRECFPCDGGQNTKGYGPPNNPSPGDPGCIYTDINVCKVNCDNPLQRIPGPGDVPPPPDDPPGAQFPIGSVGPAPGSVVPNPTTGNIQYYKCEEGADLICPNDNTTVFGKAKKCTPCSRTYINLNGAVVVDPACIYSSIDLCKQGCPEISLIGPSSQICPPNLGNEPPILRPSYPREPLAAAPGFNEPNSPSLSINASKISSQITSVQEDENATRISFNEISLNEDFRDVQLGFTEPKLFDPKLNFFKRDSDNFVRAVSNNQYLKVFKNEITEEIAKLLVSRESRDSWNEIDLQNLSDEQLLNSLNPRLVNAFQYLRYVGGKVVGVSTFLGVIRKHLLEGTMDEFDPRFYIDAAASQYTQKFEVLEKPAQKEQADRLAISYLINNLHTYQNNKKSNWRNFQINRVRPLNEDVKLSINAVTLSGSEETINIPNEGFQVDTLAAVDTVTVPSIGHPNKLNIGNGGGYYIDSTDLGLSGIAVPTDNIIPDSYYAPPPVRSKVLDMLDVDSAITITASSSENKHEFKSGDLGASAIKPLFFALNLSSVEGDYFSDSLVENYSATYSLLTASADIQTHLNNNALNTPAVSIDYRDPIYRYILDTSAFSISLNDFNLNGFKDKAFSSIGSRFVRNIPFGLVIMPVAGGMFNPLNGQSTLQKHGNVHVRSLSILPALDSSIDGETAPMFRYYSLNVEDGVNRVGIGEQESTQNIGYRYFEEDFTKTFYSASSSSYGYSATPPSAQGTAYMLREVIDYLSATYSPTSVTWYDIFSRMPVTRVGEMFYDSNESLILEIANGLRGGITVENVEAGYNTSSRVLADDSRTIISQNDRKNVTKVPV